jgi:hypothetical protein
MSANDDSYHKVCDAVWALYQAQLEKEKPRRSKRKVFLPPPPRDRPVDLLVIGISPSTASRVGFPAQQQPAEQFARDFQYLSSAGTRGPDFCNDSYYGPMVEFAQRLSSRFGVWPQVAKGDKALLVEFTDALHITTDHRIGDDLLAVMNPQADNDPVCAKCKEILEAELALYRPRVVLCNGRLPSKFIFEICTGHSFQRPVEDTMLKQTRFNCPVHFSGYLVSKWIDGFSRARLLREIRENSAF